MKNKLKAWLVDYKNPCSNKASPLKFRRNGGIFSLNHRRGKVMLIWDSLDKAL